jgi:hypothetical protein
MEQKKSKLPVIIGGIVLLALIVIFGVIYINNRPKTYGMGEKKIVLQVVNGEDKHDITIKTNEEYLGKALTDNNIVDGTTSDYGLFVVTVDGITADDASQQWWALTKDGVMTTTGVDTTPIKDGDHFEFTLTTGYDMGSSGSASESTSSAASSGADASSASAQ